MAEEEPYVGYCIDCGKHVKEYCHNYLCLECCSRQQRLMDEIYKDDP